MIATKPSDALAACQQLAGYYQAYAATGQAGGFIPPVFTGLEQAQFANVLAAAFDLSPPSGTPASAAAAFVGAVTAFWMTPPVVFGPGLVTSFPGAAALQATLVALFSNFNDAATAASGLAAALDVATKTVQVTVTPTIYTIL